MSEMRDDIIKFVKNEFGVNPEYLWMKYPEFAIFRNPSSKKWFAIVMNVKKNILGIGESGFVDVLNVKCDPFLIELLNDERGFLPAYHMSKKSWISILLDGSVDSNKIFELIKQSFSKTTKKKNI